MSPARLPPLDWAIVGVYLAGLLCLSWLVARRQRTGADYFLAGRRLGAAPLGASILANQASTASLVGAPAFVALQQGGGLHWLQYELAVPIAMLLAIGWLLPALRSVPGASVYGYLERRFDRPTRRVVAATFLLSRGLALGVILYSAALVVAAAAGGGVVPAILLLGLWSVAYTGLGGIVADIWSDVVQLVLLWGGTLGAALYLLGRPEVVAAVPLARAATLIPEFGVRAQTFGVGPMLAGGLFLYLSYYACDQSQAQRLLCARDDREARRSLLLNGLLRFPLVASYCALGLLLAGLLAVDAGFAAQLAGRPADHLVPAFVTTILPAGLRGLMIAAMLAAAMSSIDSALNSLAAVTREDVLERTSTAENVWLGRATSFGWGAFAIVAGCLFARSDAGVLELINRIGSLFFGPVLGVFTLGVMAPSVGGRQARAGLAVGLAVNAALWLAAPAVSWLWWNPAGWLATAGSATLLGAAGWRPPRWAATRRETRLLAGAFAALLALLAAIHIVVVGSS